MYGVFNFIKKITMKISITIYFLLLIIFSSCQEKISVQEKTTSNSKVCTNEIMISDGFNFCLPDLKIYSDIYNDKEFEDIKTAADIQVDYDSHLIAYYIQYKAKKNLN